MKRIIIISVIAIMIFAMILYLSAQAYQKEYDYIYKVQIHEDNYLYINVNDINQGSNFDPQHGCESRTYARSQWPLSDDRTKAMLQVALASALSHTKVHVWTRGCTSPTEHGENPRPIFYRLQLEVPY
jgi:hypothetical protein